MRRSWSALLLLAPLAAQAATRPLPEDRAKGAEAITEARLREFLGTLASPEFGGRGTGQRGFQLAADYVAAHFEALGLEPLGDDGTFLQRVPWTQVVGVPEKCRLRASVGDKTVTLGADELAGTVAFKQEAEGEGVLLTVPDPAALDVAPGSLEGRVVFLDFGTDLDAAFGVANRRGFSQALQRVRAGGAAAVLVVDDTRAQRAGGLRGTTQSGRGTSPASRAMGRNPNELYLRRESFAKVAALGTPSEAQDGVRPLGVRVALTIEIENAPAPAFNVVGRLRGGDEKLAAECVLVGSHLDHLGVNAAGVVHPGADDDGSGSAGLMAMAEAFARNPVRPRRSVVFAAFCGEEVGLVGSRHFANHPPVPLESIVAELQMDMIGRCEERRGGERAEQNRNSLHLIGTEKLSRDLHALCLDLNQRHGGFELEWDEEDVFFRSDHVNFARKGVPIAFFFTGFHPDYHQPSDTPDKIDYAKLGRVVTYVYALAFELAQREERPLVDADLWERNRELLRTAGPPAAPLRSGSR